MRHRLIILTLFAFGSLQLSGQSCTTATCNAATASRADVLAALPSNANSNATVVVNIPSGSATWSSPIVYTVPSAVTNLTIQGATTINCTGTAGASSWTCPATDSTIVIDGVTNANTPTLDITTGTSSTLFRMTGLTLKTAAGTAKNDGMLRVGGDSQNVRLDHLHIDENGQNNSMIETVGTISGVADHNLFSLGNNSNVGNGFRNFSSSDGVGDASWAAATAWGTTGNWWYLESDYFTGGSPTDCYNGGKLAVRYSTFDSIYVSALHGTKNDAGRGRSCRATEFYHIYAKGSTNSDAVVGQNGGTQLLWGNNIASGFNRFNAPGAPRNFIGGDSGTSPWSGNCGTTVRSAAGQGGTDAFDGNSSSSTGYPCLDGVGRGEGNLVTNDPITHLPIAAWPSQKLEPEYMLMNTLAAANEGAINDVSSQYNRDVYPDCGNAGSACSGSFNGTQGTGFGVLASRPATCTAGPGATYGTSPTGSYGVGYWATDDNSGNGELYVCDSTNHWTGIYQPLVFPHPLTGGTPPASSPTFSPVAGAYGAAQTLTLSSLTSGATICYTTDGSTPTANGAGTCVHGSLYSVPFTVSTTTTVKAIASKSGFTDSTVASGLFTINGSAAAPTFSPGAGSYGGTQTVTISSATSGSSLCYTSDGSTPTADGNGTCTHGTTYSSPVSVSTSQTLKAIASKAAFLDSSVSSAAYVINGTASTPTFSPVAGSYGPTQNVTISSSTAGSTICYTTNGSSPTSSSPGVCAAGSTQYVAPVAVASSLTLKAIATKAGFTDSSIGSAAYVINGAVATPTFSPVAGAYGAAQTVTIATATGSSTLCYTTDGSTPTASGGACTHGTTYSVPITVSTSQTVQAIGTKSGFSNSAVASAIYTINGTLPTPTFAPAAGGYSSAQTVTISAASGSAVVLVNTMQETANANDSIGSAVHRNTYTNCATGYSGGVLQPAGQPVGNLYCTAADKTAALAAGGPNQGVVTSTISGTGTTALDNGNGAGGTTSPSTVTATYAGTTGGDCGAHGSSASGFVSGLNFADPGGSAQLVYGLTAAGSSSILTVSKYNSSADNGRYVAQRDCWTPNSVTVGGAHYESDYNYNTTGGTYMGFGKDYDMPNKHWRAGPQGAAWINEELCPVAGGACLTTWTVPAGDSVLVESYEHWNAGCTFSSSTACAFYDAIGLQLYNAGSPVGSMVYYNVRNASTHAVISFIPINKTSWTHPQYAIQHQWDINSGSAATLTATVPFSTAVAYYTTSGTATICYTTDGSTPTGDGAGNCTHGTTYTVPFTVSTTTTVKAIATQAGFTDSAAGSATYTINGTAATPTFSPVAGTYSSTQSVTISSATAGATICYTTDGSTPTADGAGTCTHGTTYSTAVSVPSSLTIQAIASKAAFTDSGLGSAAYIITTTVRVSVTGKVGYQGNIKF